MEDIKIKNISFSPPDITDTEIEEVVKAMKSSWITTGPRTKLFEQEIAGYVGISKRWAQFSHGGNGAYPAHPGDRVLATRLSPAPIHIPRPRQGLLKQALLI
ncbi:DegT/DnrJ/EryC1/StrS family aminotransferase [Pelotomaculum propionicicum]